MSEKDKLAVLQTIKQAREFPLDYQKQYELDMTFEDGSNKDFQVYANFIKINGKSNRMETNLEQQLYSILQNYID